MGNRCDDCQLPAVTWHTLLITEPAVVDCVPRLPYVTGVLVVLNLSHFPLD
jgi:hypothetical protein